MPIVQPEHIYERHTTRSLSDWQKYLSYAEVDLLDELSKSLPPKPRVLNVGAGSGLSGLTFMSSRPDLFLFTVDVALEPNPYGGLSAEMGILKAADLLDWSRYIPIHQDSVVEGKRWSRGLLDLQFIDGAHELEECRGDIRVWWPHLRMGGIMAIHDYMKVESYARLHPGEEITDELITTLIKPYPGVTQATDELVASGRCEVITVVDTLMAVRKVGE